MFCRCTDMNRLHFTWSTCQFITLCCSRCFLSYLSLCSVDGRGSEQEGVVGLVVVAVGCVEDDLLEAAVVLADVVRRSGHGAAGMVSSSQTHLWQRKEESTCRYRGGAQLQEVSGIYLLLLCHYINKPSAVCLCSDLWQVNVPGDNQ